MRREITTFLIVIGVYLFLFVVGMEYNRILNDRPTVERAP